MYGYETKEEILAGNIGDLSANLHPYDEAEAQRRIEKCIEEGSQVFEWLAKKKSGEVFWVAAQCKERRGLHMFIDARHVEFVDNYENPCSPGNTGRIVLTDLENYAFPIIRYANGDMGRALPKQCSCGINLPLIDSVKGRKSDMFKLPDRSVLAGDYLTTLFDDFPEVVYAFQVIQKKDYSITIRVVPNRQHTDWSQILDNVKNRLVDKIRNQVPVNLEIVKDIPSDQGKIRFVISEIKS